MPFLFFWLAAALLAQHPLSQVPPDTVVASVDGQPVTAGQLQAIFSANPQAEQNFYRDSKGFLVQLAMIRHLAAQAAENGLDKQPPFREQIEFNRNMILFNAQVNHQATQIVISPEEHRKAYEKDLERYRTVAVKAIYIAFTSQPLTAAAGPKALSEPEARQKAEKLFAELQAGASFSEYVEKYSDDLASKSKGGDYGLIRRKDNIAENIRNAIFALKEGEISPPVRSNNGFYLFRAEKISIQSFDEVKNDLYIELHQARQREYLDQLRNSRQVKIEKEDLFRPAAASAKP